MVPVHGACDETNSIGSSESDIIQSVRCSYANIIQHANNCTNTEILSDFDTQPNFQDVVYEGFC